MTTSGIVEPVYVFEQFLFGMIACLEGNFPNHFRFQGFEEGLDSGVEAPIFVNKDFVCKCVDIFL